jgi:hypothetical protein
MALHFKTQLDFNDYPKITADHDFVTYTVVQPLILETENDNKRFKIQSKKIPNIPVNEIEKMVLVDKVKTVGELSLHLGGRMKDSLNLEMCTKHTLRYPKIKPNLIPVKNGDKIKVMKKVEKEETKEDLKKWAKKKFKAHNLELSKNIEIFKVNLAGVSEKPLKQIPTEMYYVVYSKI